MNHRNNAAVALFCRRLRDRLPALGLLFDLFVLGKLYHAAFHHDGHNLINPQFHRLLDDKFHLVLLGNPLKQSNACIKLGPALLLLLNRKRHVIRRERLDTAYIISPLSIACHQPVSRLQTQHIPDMINIGIQNMDLILLYLILSYIKAIQRNLPPPSYIFLIIPIM